MNQYLWPMALLVLLGYVAFDVSTHLTKRTGMETARRVFAISVAFGVSTYLLSILTDELSGVFPWFEGPILTATSVASFLAVLLGAWRIYHELLTHSRQSEGEMVDAVDYCSKQLGTMLRPLTDGIAGVHALNSAVSSRLDGLEKTVGVLSMVTGASAKSIDSQTQVVSSMSDAVAFREKQFSAMAKGYNEWYQEHRKDQEIITGLTKGAESVLEKFGTFSEELEEYLEILRNEKEGHSLSAERNEASERGAQGQEEGKNGASAETGPEHSSELVEPPKGKLTREAGMANREKGNRSQLQFSEIVLRSAGKQHRCSLKEGEPDFLFYPPDGGAPRSVGAFKALTLSEEGTKQRWIPRRKMLEEVKAAAKFGIPLILFILNLANGRTWAKAFAVEEVKKFSGITTPLALVEGDPASEKTCRETLDMALQLL